MRYTTVNVVETIIFIISIKARPPFLTHTKNDYHFKNSNKLLSNDWNIVQTCNILFVIYFTVGTRWKANPWGFGWVTIFVFTALYQAITRTFIGGCTSKKLDLWSRCLEWQLSYLIMMSWFVYVGDRIIKSIRKF